MMNKFLTLMCFFLFACTSAQTGYNYQQPQQVVSPNFFTSSPASNSGIISIQQSQPLAHYTFQSPTQFISAQPIQNAPQAQYVSRVQRYTTPAAAPVVAQYTASAPVSLVQQPVSSTPQVHAPVQQQTSNTPTTPLTFTNQHQYQQQQYQQHQYQQHQCQQHQPQTIVSKEIFIHSAPEETEVIGEQRDIESEPIRKNYRIVFIKAPIQNLRLNIAALKQAQAANEERTAIYVLSKKPDIAKIQSQLINVQNVEKTSKPEVIFIKYNTQEEANRAQREIQAQYDALGGSTHISDEGIAPITSVIGSSSAKGGSSILNKIISPRTSSVNIASTAPATISSDSVSGATNQQTIFKKFIQKDGSHITIGVNAKYLNAKTK